MLPQKLIILDTETISLNKPYIYDLGFLVVEWKEEKQRYEPILQSQQIIEQIYDNRALFTTAYYENKKLTYTNLMKGKTARKIKYGFALRHLKQVMETFNIQYLSAFNSGFDLKALKFTCDFFKIENDFSNYQWLDIHAIANNFIHLHQDYINYAVENEWFNASGYLQTNAQNTYAFLLKDPTYQEEHTSLQDCLIELDILNVCIEMGFKNETPYSKQFIKAETIQTLTLKHYDKVYTFDYNKKINHKNGDITLK